MDMDGDAEAEVENDPGVGNQGQSNANVFGLRTKVGLSCFSVRTNSDVTSVTTNRTHFVKPVSNHPTKTVSVSSAYALFT